MKAWFGPEPALGLIVMLVSVPIVGALALIFWTSLVAFYHDPLSNKALLGLIAGYALGWVWAAIRSLRSRSASA